MSLVTFARVKESIPNLPLADDVLVSHIQAACEDTIEKYCRRSFALTTYDELYHGTGTPYLHLNQRPLVSVSAVRYGLQPALYVHNSNQSNYNATITTTATGLVFTRFVNGTSSANTLLFATYPTIAQMVTAINSLGNGWVATIGGNDPFSGWVSTDLATFKQTQGCRLQVAHLLVHRWYMSDFRTNDDVGELWSTMGFGRGYHNFRVAYQAGFATLPDDLTQAICELTRTTYQALKTNANLTSESLGGYSYTVAAERGFESLSAQFKRTIDAYRSWDLVRWR